MATTQPPSTALDPVPVVVTDTVLTVRSLDDRLTIRMVRMICVAITFGLATTWFAMIYLQLIDEHGMWKPKALHQPSLFVGICEMGLVVVSVLIYVYGQVSGLRARNFAKLTVALWVAALLGLVSFGFHIYELHHPGFQLQSAYAGVFIVTESIYTVLLGVGVVVLLGLANRSRLGKFIQSGVAVEAFGEYWGFLAAVGLLNLLALYVQPFVQYA